MAALMTFLGIAFAPLGVTWAVLTLFRVLSGRGAGAGPDPHGQTRADPRRLDRLRRDLARLEREYRTLERTLEHGRDPGGPARLHALCVRYDETLVECYEALGLPAPGRPPLSGVVRLQVEASLAQRGVSW